MYSVNLYHTIMSTCYIRRLHGLVPHLYVIDVVIYCCMLWFVCSFFKHKYYG